MPAAQIAHAWVDFILRMNSCAWYIACISSALQRNLTEMEQIVALLLVMCAALLSAQVDEGEVFPLGEVDTVTAVCTKLFAFNAVSCRYPDSSYISSGVWK